MIAFKHEEFEDELYVVQRYCMIVEEGPSDSFFSNNETVVEAEVVEEAAGSPDEDTDAVDALITRLANLHTGAEIDAEINHSGVVIENDNDPLPENYQNVTDEECVYEDWGHTGVYHRRQIVALNHKPSLKVRYNEKLNRVGTFELMSMKDYLKDVIVSNINKTIEGPRVTYGEYLRWLRLWFLMLTVIGPSRDAFFSHCPCDEFSEAPLRLTQYMTKRRFERILKAVRYSKSKPPKYKDRFWEVREMIESWNANMERVFAPGWVNCLDESMSPWTNKYTCPGWVFLPRKPWPIGNEYHSICCCQSGIMWAVELVEGWDRPPEKPEEKFSDITKNGSTTSLFLRLCESIFHIGLVVILDTSLTRLLGQPTHYQVRCMASPFIFMQ